MILLLNSLKPSDANYKSFMSFTQNKFNTRVKGK